MISHKRNRWRQTRFPLGVVFSFRFYDLLFLEAIGMIYWVNFLIPPKHCYDICHHWQLYPSDITWGTDNPLLFASNSSEGFFTQDEMLAFFLLSLALSSWPLVVLAFERVITQRNSFIVMVIPNRPMPFEPNIESLQVLEHGFWNHVELCHFLMEEHASCPRICLVKRKTMMMMMGDAHDWELHTIMIPGDERLQPQIYWIFRWESKIGVNLINSDVCARSTEIVRTSGSVGVAQEKWVSSTLEIYASQIMFKSTMNAILGGLSNQETMEVQRWTKWRDAFVPVERGKFFFAPKVKSCFLKGETSL